MIERSEMQFFEVLIKFLEARVCVEVGVAYGDGTLYMCRGAQQNNGHVYGFDIWNRHGLKKQFSSFSSLEKVSERLKKEGVSNFTLTQIDTIGEKSRFEKEIDRLCPQGIDFAFIDGCHSYLGIKNDFSVIYPRIKKATGVIGFHDTLMIDGCREFVLDLRTKYHDGTFDIVDFPFGCHSGRRIGVTLLVKRSHPILDSPITEVCGSISTEQEIENREVTWYLQECARNIRDMKLLSTQDTMQFHNLGDHKQRKKFET